MGKAVVYRATITMGIMCNLTTTTCILVVMLYGYGYHAHPEVAHVTTQDVQGINPPVLWSMTIQGVENVQYWVTTGIVDLQGMNGDLLSYDIQMIGQAIANAMQTMGLLGYDLQLMGQVITNAMQFMLGYTNMQEGQ